MKNKIIAHLTIVLILVGVFCNVCTTYNRISVYDCSVYAEADNWSSCDSSDLVTAFRYYCKSRNLAINGSAADALTSFTTTTFNNICSTLGIDPTSLQAELKKTTEGNLGLRFLFSRTGITAYNRIFSEFLQNNDLSVGDTVDDETIYSGESFTDGNGNTCLIWDLPSATQGYNANQLPNKWGTTYKYNGSDIKSIYDNGNNTFSLVVNRLNGSPYTITENIHFKNAQDGIENIYSSVGIGTDGWPSGLFFADGISYGQCIVYHVNGGSYLYVGQFCDLRNIGSNEFTKNCRWRYFDYFTSPDGLEDANINITTNNNTINNNTYNNNYTIIYNGGDTYISDDDDEPLPTTPPSGGGGGGGGDNPTNPDFPPVDPTPTPPPTIPDWDIELPEMPTGNDWLLYGLEKKFPWDIPFNLMYMLSLFAADPETPHFEGTLDLKIVQWDYDIDLAPFDDIAGYVRNIEFIGFLIGLMLLTNKLIWG